MNDDKRYLVGTGVLEFSEHARQVTIDAIYE